MTPLINNKYPFLKIYKQIYIRSHIACDSSEVCEKIGPIFHMEGIQVIKSFIYMIYSLYF